MSNTKIFGANKGISTQQVVSDNTDASVLIEGSDGLDYLEIDTDNSNPKVILAAGGAKVGIGTTDPGELLELSDGTRKLQFDIGTSDTATEIAAVENDLKFATRTGFKTILFGGTGGEYLRMNHQGKLSTNETTALCDEHGLHLKIADSGLANPHANADDFVIEGSGETGMTFSSPSNTHIRFQKDGNSNNHGITFDVGTSSIRTFTGGTARLYIDDAGRTKFLYAGVQFFAGQGADDANTEPLYLADSGATLIIDARKGNFGDVTLTADVTAIKFIYAPSDGSVFTLRAKITQHASSAKTISYADSAVSVHSGSASSSAVTGEIKFPGGTHHTMTTATGAVDIVEFTIFARGSTFNVFATVVGQNYS
tara:strand:- start:213 stop:1316 length:1104 start_codon:yes stop_codon:yes gene_type:complete